MKASPPGISGKHAAYWRDDAFSLDTIIHDRYTCHVVETILLGDGTG
jgi:hypothetical protein